MSDPSTGAIAGTVRNAAGEPVEGAVVMFAAPSPPHRDIAAVTAATGSFGLGNLEPGTYTVAVNALGYRTGRATVQVDGGREAAVVITMERDSG
jgi:Carboxypeptidase regulatory-like domain